MKTTTGSLISALKTRPEIIAMLIIVGAFLYHIESSETKNIATEERRDAREDLVAKERIKRCHDIQALGIDALDRNAAALLLHASSYASLTESINTVSVATSSTNKSLLEVQAVLASLITEIDIHAKYSKRNEDTLNQ